MENEGFSEEGGFFFSFFFIDVLNILFFDDQQ